MVAERLLRLLVEMLVCVGVVTAPEILARHFHQVIGLKVDSQRWLVYFTDLGGSVSKVNLKTMEKKSHSQ